MPYLPGVLRSILAGTAIVGSLDILEVIAFYGVRSGVPPTRIVQGVAAGLYGRASFEGGIRTALIGLAIHFVVAFCVVAVYHLAARRISFLTRHPFLAGTLYGFGVWAFMGFVVMPLSAIGHPPNVATVIANGLFAHVFCVGIPAALTARLQMLEPATSM